MKPIEAVIEGDEIAIRVPIDALQLIAIGGWAAGYIDPVRIDDAPAFAKAMCRAINEESEDGTTPLHEMIDHAIEGAIEWGEGEVIDEEEAERIVAKLKRKPRKAKPAE